MTGGYLFLTKDTKILFDLKGGFFPFSGSSIREFPVQTHSAGSAQPFSEPRVHHQSNCTPEPLDGLQETWKLRVHSLLGTSADGTWLNSTPLPFSKGVGWLAMQKWEGIKEYHMVGGKILGTEFAGSFFFLFFFWCYFLWVSAGWYVFKLFYQSTFNDPQKQFSL